MLANFAMPQQHREVAAILTTCMGLCVRLSEHSNTDAVTVADYTSSVSKKNPELPRRHLMINLACFSHEIRHPITYSNITYSFIANCQTAVVHKNKTKRRSKIYKSQYILRYNILTVKLQSVIREMRSGSCLL